MSALEAMKTREAGRKAAALRKKKREQLAAEARKRAERAERISTPKNKKKKKGRTLKDALKILGRMG